MTKLEPPNPFAKTCAHLRRVRMWGDRHRLVCLSCAETFRTGDGRG